MITTQKELRRAFWEQHPGADRRLIKDYAGTGRMYCTGTIVAWWDFLDSLSRSGEIPEALADRATLQPSKISLDFEVQGNYGAHGWETECSESTRREALRRLREYREDGPGLYRLRVRRTLVSRG
jgi:hypothetical protein